MEDRARARLREHRDREAGVSHAAHRADAGRAPGRGRLPDGSALRPAGSRRHGRPAPDDDPRVAKISFTGSTEVGTQIMQEAANNITRVSLELGGKSANVVFADADLDVCVEKSIWAVFDNAGQDCCARSRAFVERPIYDEFVERLRQAHRGDRGRRAARRGHRDGSAHLAGSATDLARLHRARRGRGRAPCDRRRRPRPCRLLPAAGGARRRDNDMRVAQEEIFGPGGVHLAVRHRRGGDPHGERHPRTGCRARCGRGTSAERSASRRASAPA